MPPELHITAEDHAYLKAAIKKAGYREVGFLGVVELFRPEGEGEEQEPDIGLVRHLRILKQETTSGEVDFDDEAFADFLEWLYIPEDEGGAGFEGTEYGLFSAHSHGNMDVFWSSTDEDAIKKYGISAPWIFSSVFNTRGESRHRLDVFKDVNEYCPLITSEQIKFTDCKLWVEPHPDARPVIDEITRVGDKYAKQIKAAEEILKDLKKQEQDEIKDLEKGLQDATGGALANIGDRVDDDFKRYVSSHSHQTTVTRSTPNNSGGTDSGKASGNSRRNGSSGGSSSSSQGSSGKAGNAGGVGAGENNGISYERDTSIPEVKDLMYRVVDTDIGSVYGTSLRQVLKDEDLVLLEPIESEVLARLETTELEIIKARDYENYLGLHDKIDKIIEDDEKLAAAEKKSTAKKGKAKTAAKK